MDQPVLETKEIAKEFSGVRVLNGINARLERGRILGIIGENGAGKSTLVKIINGTCAPTSGQLLFEGQAVRHMDAERARRLGISTIPQEFNLIESLDVCENIFLGRENRAGGVFLDKKAMRRKAAALLEELRTPVSVDARIPGLSVAQKQMVEIAKAVVNECRLLIMDEPTTMLARGEVEVLFSLMRRLREQGAAIIYISHKLKEVRQICDEVMVLRDGEFISRDPASAISEHEMACRMVGRELSQMFPPKSRPTGEVVFSVAGLSVPGAVRDVSFELHRGEILGFAGLVGAGRTETAEGIYGVRRHSAGRIALGGETVRISSPRDAVRHGIAYLSEDRQSSGIHTAFSVVHNTTMISLRQYGRLFTARRREGERAAGYAKRFNLKAPSLAAKLAFLSGGNQQKVALAKGLDPGPRVFIFDEPTRGIDVNARSEIYSFVHDLVAKGIGCILISSDLEEVIGMSNRVVVMREGRIAGILEGDRINEEEIMLFATGVKGRSADEETRN